MSNQAQISIPQTLARNKAGDKTLLDLSFKSLNDQVLTEIAPQLASLPPLNILILSCNSIGPVGLAAVIAAVKHHPLTHVDVSANSIGDAGVVALTELLESCESLTALDLRANQITDDGVTSLCGYLTSNPNQLEHLDLSANYIKDQGAAKLGEVVARTTTLKSLNLLTNDISPTGVLLLGDIIKQSGRDVEFNSNKNRSELLDSVCTVS